MADATRETAGSAHEALGLVGAAVAVIDADAVVRGWTAAAEQLLGHPAGEVVGRSAARLLTPGDSPAQLSAWAARARLREPWSGVIEIRHRDGHGVRTMIQSSPLSGAGRTDWFVTATDLTTDLSWPPPRTSVSAALLARSPIGVSIWDLDMRCVWVNSTAERQDATLRRPRLGRLMTEVQTGYEGRAIEGAMRQVVESGTPVIEREYRWRAPDGEELVLSSSYFRLDGADGRPLGVCNVATDISKSRARQHLLTLGVAGTRIGTTLDVLRTAQELADVAVPLVADFVTVDLAESIPLGEEPSQRPASTGAGLPVFRRAGVASIHSGLPEPVAKVGEVVFVPPSSPFTDVLMSGKSHFEPQLDASPGTWLDQDPDRARAIKASGMHSLMVVPLRARGTVLGVTVFLRTDTQEPFSRDDLLLVEELAARAALSLDNARRYTRERTASLALQRDLLPQRLFGGHAVEVASRYLPADTHEGVGGDWFDVIPLPCHRVGLVVGDIVGHGIGAAARMGQLRTVVRTLADLDLPPDVLLSRLDDLVLRLAEQDGGEQGPPGPVMRATCVYATYDPATRRCVLARAGHPPPAIVSPGGAVTFPELPSGTPIGLGLMRYESVELELPEGSVIALYSDGLIETRTADLDAGLGRLGAALARPVETLEELCSGVITAMTPDRQPTDPGTPGIGVPGIGAGAGITMTEENAEDDITLLLARTRVSGPPAP